MNKKLNQLLKKVKVVTQDTTIESYKDDGNVSAVKIMVTFPKELNFVGFMGYYDGRDGKTSRVVPKHKFNLKKELDLINSLLKTEKQKEKERKERINYQEYNLEAARKRLKEV